MPEDCQATAFTRSFRIGFEERLLLVALVDAESPLPYDVTPRLERLKTVLSTGDIDGDGHALELGPRPTELRIESIVGNDRSSTRSEGLPVKRTAAALVFVAAIVLALLWTHTPLADYVNRDNVLDLAEGVAKSWWTPLVLVCSAGPGDYALSTEMQRASTCVTGRGSSD